MARLPGRPRCRPRGRGRAAGSRDVLVRGEDVLQRGAARLAHVQNVQRRAPVTPCCEPRSRREARCGRRAYPRPQPRLAFGLELPLQLALDLERAPPLREQGLGGRRLAGSSGVAKCVVRAPELLEREEQRALGLGHVTIAEEVVPRMGRRAVRPASTYDTTSTSSASQPARPPRSGIDTSPLYHASGSDRSCP